jgi:hypothetical protein
VRSVRCSARGGERYTFEAEIITRARWAGFPVLESPVRCRYFTDAERVSHFRPWRDSWAQAFMHVRLGLRALAPWPLATHGAGCRAAARLFDWFDPRRAWRNARASHLGRLELTAALGLGVWIGMWPGSSIATYGGWGLALLITQALAGLYFAWRLHLHPVVVLLGTLVVLPPAGAALGMLSTELGRALLAVWLRNGAVDAAWAGSARWLGGTVLGFAAGMAVFWTGVALGRCVPLPNVRGVAKDPGQTPRGAAPRRSVRQGAPARAPAREVHPAPAAIPGP